MALSSRVAVGESCSTQELGQCFFECEIAGRASRPPIADEFAAIDNLNVSLLGEDPQGGRESLGCDVGWPSNGRFGFRTCGDAND